MVEKTVYDHQIRHINRDNKENNSCFIVYEDNEGLHTIDLNSCADNYRTETKRGSRTCVGERNSMQWYFLLYTSGVKTKIVFKKTFIFNLSGKYLFSGSRESRFSQVRKILTDAKYTTFDIT